MKLMNVNYGNTMDNRNCHWIHLIYNRLSDCPICMIVFSFCITSSYRLNNIESDAICLKSIEILPGGITAVVTGYWTVSALADAFEINPTVLSRTIAAHIFNVAFHVNGWRICLIAVVVVVVVGLSLLRPPSHRAVAKRWADVNEDTHIFHHL